MIKANNFNFLFSNMKDGICVTNQKGQVEYVNDAAVGIFQNTKEEIEGKKIWQIIPISEKNDDFIQLFVDAVTDKKASHEAIVDYESDSGKVSKLRICMHYTEDADENTKSIVFVITDLTELIRVNKAFARYTSTEIAKHVLETEGGEALGGERREVTILMSDLRGFTALSTRLSPEDLITLLNHYFEAMTAIIEKYHGTIIEFLGDGLFITFNAPNDITDHASVAVACALEMECAMEKVNEWNRQQGFPDLEMGVGINTGEVVVGNIGSMDSTKYGCMGENVNLAGRVETFTVGGQIYVSEKTVSRISAKLKISGQQKFLPKGAKQELCIYDVVGIGGDYNIYFERGGYDYEPAKKPEAVEFRLLEGKAVEAGFSKGKIVAISESYAVLETEKELVKSNNIMLDISGDLYAKVMEQTEEGYIICFTAKPASFKDWYKRIMDL